MARKKQPPVAQEDARTVGSLLRSLRRAAGFRAVQDAAEAPGCPAARQTIYAYERGGLTPSLKQFLDLVEFYAVASEPRPDAKQPEDLRAQAVSAIVTALTLPAYHMVEAMQLMGRLQAMDHGGRKGG
jgi:transcriptional regulator with XRE-family HTH domain